MLVCSFELFRTHLVGDLCCAAEYCTELDQPEAREGRGVKWFWIANAKFRSSIECDDVMVNDVADLCGYCAPDKRCVCPETVSCLKQYMHKLSAILFDLRLDMPFNKASSAELGNTELHKDGFRARIPFCNAHC